MNAWFRSFVSLSLFLFLITGSLTAGQAADQASNLYTIATAEIQNTSHEGVTFTLYTPAATIDKTGRPHVSGLTDIIREAGAPALSVYTTLVVVPPNATVSVTTNPIHETTAVVGHIPPTIAPKMANVSQSAAEIHVPTIAETNPPNPKIYEADALYPTNAYTVSEPMYYRDIRFVRLHLYPLRYNAVTKQLWQATELGVTVQFEGADLRQTRTKGKSEGFGGLETAVINPQHLQQWRHLPTAVKEAPGTTLPIDRDTFKIEVTEDGLYDISFETLQAAGMDVATVNPHTFAMLHRGQPVAYQFVGDDDTQFEAGETVRFYGWAFAGSRYEKLFVDTNVFWLWAGDTPNLVGSQNNQANQAGFSASDSFRSSITYEEDLYHFTGWANDWSLSPNEPDTFFADYIAHGASGSNLPPYTIELPNPDPAGETAEYTVEIMGRRRSNTNYTYHAQSSLNDLSTFAEQTWTKGLNFNLVETVPANSIRHGTNEFHLAFTADNLGSSGTAEYFLNRITVDYTRRLIASKNELIFGDDQGGQKTFQVAGFATGDAAEALVWNISNPYEPQQITIESQHIIDNGDGYTYLIGSEHDENGRFIATTHNNIKTPSVSLYQPTDLNPAGNEADWIIITHGDFAAAADTLAAHRAAPEYGGLKAHRVTTEDIINQYGYGLNIPAAIRDYLTFALGNWTTAPRYVVLLGDGTFNPKQLECFSDSPSCGGWDANDATFVVTEIAFVDRFQGQIVSDHPLVLLSGNDLVADMSIGRISATSLEEANYAVSKIIKFEEEELNQPDWQKNSVFVADIDDPSAGFFCDENALAAEHMPDEFTATHLCFNEDEIPDGSPPTNAQTDALRAELGHHINTLGTGFVNYRGHGGRNFWGYPSILSTNQSHLEDFWTNFGRPVVVLSADCLDGHFGWPGIDSLSETWLRMDQVRGTAAHWSSVGLGYSFEHTILHEGFYDGLKIGKQARIGDAVNYAKLAYIKSQQHESELYSFTLQGDPAMRIYRPTFTLSLPIISKG